MIAGTTTQELQALREESDWVAEQLQRLQHMMLHLTPAKHPHSTERQPSE